MQKTTQISSQTAKDSAKPSLLGRVVSAGVAALNNLTSGSLLRLPVSTAITSTLYYYVKQLNINYLQKIYATTATSAVVSAIGSHILHNMGSDGKKRAAKQAMGSIENFQIKDNKEITQKLQRSVSERYKPITAVLIDRYRNLCNKAGIKAPPTLYIMPISKERPEISMAAMGDNKNSYAIQMSEGFLTNLVLNVALGYKPNRRPTNDELKTYVDNFLMPILAHELTHITNNDMKRDKYISIITPCINTLLATASSSYLAGIASIIVAELLTLYISRKTELAADNGAIKLTSAEQLKKSLLFSSIINDNALVAELIKNPPGNSGTESKFIKETMAMVYDSPNRALLQRLMDSHPSNKQRMLEADKVAKSS